MKAGIPVLLCVVLIVSVEVCGCTGPALVKEIPRTTFGTGTDDIPQGKGQYSFIDVIGNSDRPITVYTYRPAAWNLSGPVLIVIPGAGREGQSPRETWIPFAERYSSLLIVPEFSLENYPGDYWYNAGNTFDSSGKWNPTTNWTYMAVEHLFDDIRKKTGTTQNTYLIFGHSAGAQFVHRMVTLLPEARYSRAVAANSGLYLIPVYTIRYPFGLKDSPLPESNLRDVFARKLIVMSGGSDTDPDDPGLANFPEAKTQGTTRFERAWYYFNSAQSEAQRIHAPFNWEYHVVPGVGHSESGMAGPSAEQMFSRT